MVSPCNRSSSARTRLTSIVYPCSDTGFHSPEHVDGQASPLSDQVLTNSVVSSGSFQHASCCLGQYT